MPDINSDIFKPIRVGKALSRLYTPHLGDDTGDSISSQNQDYAELTALYWAWKNDRESEYIGLNHYRRLFVFDNNLESTGSIFSDRIVCHHLDNDSVAKYGWNRTNLKQLLDGNDIVLARPYIVDCHEGAPKNVKENFVGWHGADAWHLMRTVIKKHFPEYLSHVDMSGQSESLSLCNLLIMRRHFLDDYCSLLFSFLNIFMNYPDRPRYDHVNTKRMPAFIAERFLNAYISFVKARTAPPKIGYMPYVYLENIESKIVTPIGKTDGDDVLYVSAAFDTNYVGCFSVMLQSVMEGLSAARRCWVIALVDRVSEDDMYLLSHQVAQFPNVEISFVGLDEYFNKEDAVQAHFTKAAFFRLLLPEMLPCVDKVLYLDSDMVICDDISRIYDIDIGDNFAAVVKDLIVTQLIRDEFKIDPKFGDLTLEEYWNGYLGLSDRSKETYFNSGVSLLNLSLMRERKVSSDCINMFWERPFYYVEQDILNIVFDGRVKLLDSRWNVPAHSAEFMELSPYSDYQSFLKARRNPGIIHFAASHLKPWHTSNVDFFELFWYYARKTPFADRLGRTLSGDSCAARGSTEDDRIVAEAYAAEKAVSQEKIAELERLLKAEQYRVPDLAGIIIKPAPFWLRILGWLGRERFEYRFLKKYTNIDWTYYVTTYPEVAHVRADPVVDYLRKGNKDGKNPVLWFDSRYYKENNPDVVKSGMNCFVHYLLHGHGEGRRANPYWP